MSTLTWKDIKWFSASDFDDKFSQNKGEDISLDLVGRLDSLREWINCPIIVTEGYDSKGHSDMSYHYKGLAADIIICTTMDMREQWNYIKIAGFDGIGIYPHWKYKVYSGGWHVDLRDIPQIWRQMPDGKYVYFLP